MDKLSDFHATYDRTNLNITFGNSRGSDRSSFSDQEHSDDLEDSNPSDPEDAYEEWAPLRYPDELNPSDSASRARTSRPLRSAHPAVSHPRRRRRRLSTRSFAPERGSLSRRPLPTRSPSSESSESVDSSEEYGGPYAPATQGRRFFPLMPPTPYNAYPPGAPLAGPPFMPPNGPRLRSSDQLVRFAHPNQIGHQVSPNIRIRLSNSTRPFVRLLLKHLSTVLIQGSMLFILEMILGIWDCDYRAMNRTGYHRRPRPMIWFHTIRATVSGTRINWSPACLRILDLIHLPLRIRRDQWMEDKMRQLQGLRG